TGPYEAGTGIQTVLTMGANSRIALPESGDNVGSRTNQPTIRLIHRNDGANSLNNVLLYFGGLGDYNNSYFEIRRNTGLTTSEQIAVFRQDYIRLNRERIYFSNTSAHIEEIGDSLTIWSSGDAMNGVRIWHSGQVDFISDGQPIHKFYTSGSKLGGSIEIDGERYGMFPTDSAQSLIEYVEFDVEVDGTTEVLLDEKYLKAIENFSVWTNNPEIQVVEKTDNSVILTGQGKTDILIKGFRRDMS